MQIPRSSGSRGMSRRMRRRRTRTGIVAFLLIVAVVGLLIWQPWKSSDGGKTVGTGTTSPSGSPSGRPTVNGKKNPIKHVVFLVKENRTFDNYFGQYPGADGATEGKGLSSDNTKQIDIPLTPGIDEQ